MTGIVGQLLDGPLVLVDVVAQTHFRVDIVTEEVNVRLIFWSSVKRRELKECLFDGAIVVHVDGVLEHVVHKVRAWFDEIVES